MPTTLTRLRAAIDAWFPVVVAVFACLLVVGGFLTYTAYVAPGTTTEERPVDRWSTSGSFDHAATVEEPNDVYPAGTTLRNRSHYFPTIAPVLNTTFRFGYAASHGGDVTLETDTELVLRSVRRDRPNDEPTVYWETTSSLGQQTRSTVPPNETVTTSTSVNVSALQGRYERITDELGSAPGEPEGLIRVTVGIAGTINDRPVERVETYALPIALGEPYAVEDPGPRHDEHTATRTVVVDRQPGPLRSIGGPIVLIAAVGALTALVVTRASGTLGPTYEERQALEFEADRADYDDWISTIALPEDVASSPRAEAASLGDLVDFAIDTNESVIEDPDRGAYYVRHEGHLYSFTPPATVPTADRDVDLTGHRSPTTDD